MAVLQIGRTVINPRYVVSFRTSHPEPYEDGHRPDSTIEIVMVNHKMPFRSHGPRDEIKGIAIMLRELMRK